ncbi:hypothetical protein ILYODFUR_036554 [Ilyodon furcidens]|uniref:Secreted protein n=1 Tax=Ilyodon furcidens TaxID=33524 RepID=A0ABV0U0R1_9TELE
MWSSLAGGFCGFFMFPVFSCAKFRGVRKLLPRLLSCEPPLCFFFFYSIPSLSRSSSIETPKIIYLPVHPPMSFSNLTGVLRKKKKH